MTAIGPGTTAVQTAVETRFVVDCKVNPVALVGHNKITLAAERMMVRVVKVCAVTRSAGIKPRPAISAGRKNRFLMYVFMG